MANLPKKIGLIVLNPIGRSGSYFLHGLFDSHPEVLCLPSTFDFYHFWRRFHAIRESADPEDMLQSLIDGSNLGYLFGRYSPDFAYLGDDGNPHALRLDRAKFVAKVLEKARPDQTRPLERKSLLLAIHESYAELMGMDLREKKWILLHEHAGFPYLLPDSFDFRDPLTDFPQARFIFTTREPKNAHASLVRTCSQYGPLRAIYHELRALAATVDAAQNALALEDWIPAQVYFSSTEQLNADLPKLFQRLTDWLGISGSPTPPRSTFAGHPRPHLSAFADAKGKAQSVLENRWLSTCSEREGAILEELFSGIMARMNYPRELLWKVPQKGWRLILSSDKNSARLNQTASSTPRWVSICAAIWSRLWLYSMWRSSRVKNQKRKLDTASRTWIRAVDCVFYRILSPFHPRPRVEGLNARGNSAK